MKLDKLKIANFKNLCGFEINFDEGSQTTVIVGRNGTGKSNLLEALIIIFRDLDLNAPPLFQYELEYLCHSKKVRVDADPERSKEKVRVTIDDEPISYKRFTEQTEQRYLPSYVFGYYSGPSNRMELHFEKHQERFYKDLLANVDKPLRPLLYARLVHSQFVLLAFFNEKDQKILDFLKDNLRIEGLESILFIMRDPLWPSSEGDPRFWNARGTVQGFLSKLYELALAPIRINQRVNLGFRKSSELEHLYLYLRDIDALKALAEAYPNQQEFFKALESTYISNLISEVRIRVKIRSVNDSLTFRDLSEGEQQLLMVLGLLRFTKAEEALFLLDEPDTHLNPAWSMQYLNFLRSVVDNPDNSHIIMSTHNPLVIAGLERSQVQIMQRDEATGLISVDLPEKDPRGMGVGVLLTSDIYGLRSQLDPQTLELLDQKRELAIKDTLTDSERLKLTELNQHLEGLDLTTNVRDPLYRPFVEEMTAAEKREGLQIPVLTKEQQERRKELAREILQRLRATKRQEA